jgi:glycosyltransferase involved in cell wall biosynthesis
VLFVLPQLSPGGAERMVLALARSLNSSYFHVYVAYFFDGSLEDDYSGICQRIFHIHKGKGLDFRAMGQLSQIIHIHDIHVINAHHYMPYFYSFPGAKVMHRRRLVYTEHSVAEVNRISGPHKCICNFMLRQTDAAIGVSKEIAQRLTAGFPLHADRILSIPNGLDVERYQARTDRVRTRKTLNISANDFVIGSVANFRRVKNHACLVRACHQLSGRFPLMRFVLVGRGYPEDAENTEDDIRGMISKLDLEDKVVIAGYREDIPELLSSFDIFCLPSLSEGLPMSLLEAMAAGVPVIGSDVAGIRELIIHEETGLLFPSNDHGALGKNVERLFNEPSLRSRIAENALQLVSAHHSLERWSQKYAGLFGV